MNSKDYDVLLNDLNEEFLFGNQSIGILGLTPVALKLLDSYSHTGLSKNFEAIYAIPSDHHDFPILSLPVKPIEELQKAQLDVIVVASDEDKEELLEAALPFFQGSPKLLVSGYSHHAFRDPIFHEIQQELLVPSLAFGYPHSLIHIYQCLTNAAKLKLDGVVVEFGMFKGGTTMFISKLIERLGMNWPVLGLDTFAGFPARRSPLDMYAHPACVSKDLETTKRYLSGRNVEIVEGDVVETCQQLIDKDLVLSFIDTDNYTSALSALKIVKEKTVVNGTIIFDHFTGVDRFCYTLGEKMAAKTLLDDDRYFNLHGTGVFQRQH